ncbi:NAD(P)H-dependent flavin oxidoreductase [Roseomonas xinghualingensis]|uniref:NAD(P)H-dependent flavin oxidoreductase n=1 Tax=Roseomonas xinghualingensis TaxID=2986475 RepID=UPI0021F1AC24|nr:nitronate monooxygenase family protein [Roseomonas sp. SXEYE001]MCV4208496.1 nitronate monooxygenase family protein [Roseomonas sp. SXEYE001]
MKPWQDRRILDLFGIELPIIQAPMAGATTPEMVIAASEAGGLGSLPAAQYTAAQFREAVAQVRAGTSRPVNLNFFAHAMPPEDPARQAAWKGRLAPYYCEAGLDPEMPTAPGGRAPFDADFCAVVEEARPEVASFHFGLPEKSLLDRVRAVGCKVIASATTVAEAVWLEEHGVDAVIAQGFEAGGHRGNFLTHDMATQVGTMALVPQVADAVRVPVIAAGGIADHRGVLAAFALGAAAAQVGTAYLLTPEARILAVHRRALKAATADSTALTNLFTGRPARGILNRVMREVGPLSDLAPAFPTAGGALAPLRAKAEEAGSSDFTNLWSGQAAALAREMPAGELTRRLAGG